MRRLRPRKCRCTLRERMSRAWSPETLALESAWLFFLTLCINMHNTGHWSQGDLHWKCPAVEILFILRGLCISAMSSRKPSLFYYWIQCRPPPEIPLSRTSLYIFPCACLISPQESRLHSSNVHPQGMVYWYWCMTKELICVEGLSKSIRSEIQKFCS